MHCIAFFGYVYFVFWRCFPVFFFKVQDLVNLKPLAFFEVVVIIKLRSPFSEFFGNTVKRIAGRNNDRAKPFRISTLCL
jgi:hypothetical protein